MGKKKNKNGDKHKAKLMEKKENKFEQKINKQKHHVLGQKIVKGNKGQPGHSKSLSIKKRMETLLVEYKGQGKDNFFNDKRIGEKDKTITSDEKNLKRFRLARKSHAKLFNLGDGEEEEEELTHAGQKLSEIENFEDPQISDDEEEDRKISFEMQKEHFGGGKFEGESRNKSHTDKMAELVLQSIISKNARKKEKNELLNEIDEINISMKNILPKLNSQLTNGSTEKILKPDTLDLKMKMLMFLPKGNPSDKSKSEEEKNKEEKDKLEELENERLQRMKIPVKKSSMKMHSVDDLYSNIDFDKKSKDKKVKFTSNEKNKESNDDELENKSDNEYIDIDDNLDSDNESVDVDLSEDDDNTVKESDEDDDLSDVLSILSDVSQSKESSTKKNLDELNTEKILSNVEEIKSYDDFVNLMKLNKNNELCTINKLQKEFYKRIINEETNEFENLFDYLFKFIINVLSDDKHTNFKLSENLIKPLYELMQKDVVHAGICMASELSKIQENYILLKNSNKTVSNFPSVKIIIFCSLVSTLMSTSDFHHHVCSPTMLFMTQILNECKIMGVYDVAYGLTISSILLEMVSISKRFIPELINFCTLVLLLANGSTNIKKFEEKINLKQVRNRDVIHIDRDMRSQNMKLPICILKIFEIDVESLDNDAIKLDLIFLCLELVSKSVDLYTALPSFNEIFVDVIILIKLLPVHFYPDRIKISANNIMAKIKSTKKTYHHLSFTNSKPKPLKLFEPKIDSKIDDRKKLHGSREFKVQQRELIKLKKMKKGTEREIRKDQRFLREHILADKINKNKEREEKTKRIMNSLMVQEGEFKTLLKRKKLAGKKKKVPTATLR